MFLHSPLNYTGGKFKLLPQIMPLFPNDINTFVDLFAGGLNVAINVKAQKIICNDINNYVIDLYKYFQSLPIKTLLKEIHDCIDKYELTDTNLEGYLKLRNDYNDTHDSLLFFMLICYGFNNQIRFNNSHQFNNAYGKGVTRYNSKIENDLIEFHKHILNCSFYNGNYKDFNYEQLQKGDFVYADPPYLISCAAYNDGKRGFEGWNKDDDKILYDILDELNNRGIKFALSNVFEHKHMKNDYLIEWSKKYNTHYLNMSYSNANYQAKQSKQSKC